MHFRTFRHRQEDGRTKSGARKASGASLGHQPLAGPDFLAVDRVEMEIMGIPSYAVGYLQYAAELGVGQYDLSKIDIRGEKPEAVKKTFRLHQSANDQLQWLNNLVKPA